MPLTLPAHAKINLGLAITGRKGDYHLIHTVFQELDFGDEITLHEDRSGRISLDIRGSRSAGVPPGQENLCVAAAQLLRARTGAAPGVRMELTKRVPAGAGLGGGSSDAAAVLNGLNTLWGTGLKPPELEALAAGLGADVPFFIRGGLQLGAGIGETLTPLDVRLPYAVVLVISPFEVDTAWAYGQFANREHFPPPPGFDRLLAQERIPWERFVNDFETVVFPRYPQLAEIKAALLEDGAVYASLSGSGGTIHGHFERAPRREDLSARFAGCQVEIARPVSTARE